MSKLSSLFPVTIKQDTDSNILAVTTTKPVAILQGIQGIQGIGASGIQGLQGLQGIGSPGVQGIQGLQGAGVNLSSLYQDQNNSIYIGSTTNAVTVDTTGSVELIGSAIVWERIRARLITSPNSPLTEKYELANSTFGLYLHSFDAGSTNELIFDLQLPTTWQPGSTIYPYIHWSPKTSGVADTLIGWSMEYSKAGPGTVFPSPTTIVADNIKIGNITQQNSHIVSSFDSITMTGETADTLLVGKIYRSAGDTALITGGVLSIDFDIAISKLGNAARLINQVAPIDQVFSNGIWNDVGTWDDTALWYDGGVNILATGVWNDTGIWSDAALWSDGTGSSIFDSGAWSDTTAWLDETNWNDGA
jgi:hypothetical protein